MSNSADSGELDLRLPISEKLVGISGDISLNDDQISMLIASFLDNPSIPEEWKKAVQDNKNLF